MKILDMFIGKRASMGTEESTFTIRRVNTYIIQDGDKWPDISVRITDDKTGIVYDEKLIESIDMNYKGE